MVLFADCPQLPAALGSSSFAEQCEANYRVKLGEWRNACDPDSDSGSIKGECFDAEPKLENFCGPSNQTSLVTKSTATNDLDKSDDLPHQEKKCESIFHEKLGEWRGRCKFLSKLNPHCWNRAPKVEQYCGKDGELLSDYSCEARFHLAHGAWRAVCEYHPAVSHCKEANAPKLEKFCDIMRQPPFMKRSTVVDDPKKSEGHSHLPECEAKFQEKLGGWRSACNNLWKKFLNPGCWGRAPRLEHYCGKGAQPSEDHACEVKFYQTRGAWLETCPNCNKTDAPKFEQFCASSSPSPSIKPRAINDQRSSPHLTRICEAQFWQDLGGWRHHCNDIWRVLNPWCWSRAPRVDHYCGKGYKPSSRPCEIRFHETKGALLGQCINCAWDLKLEKFCPQQA